MSKKENRRPGAVALTESAYQSPDSFLKKEILPDMDPKPDGVFRFTKWEFKTFLLTDDCDQSPALASLGEQGWELVAVVGIGNGAVQKMFLKRQIV